MKVASLILLTAALCASTARAQSDDANRQLQSARAHMQQGDFKGAVAELDRALAAKPNFVPALYTRAGAKMLSDDMAGALADVEKVIELDPDFKPAYHTRATIRFRKGDYDAALADYDHSIAVGWLAYESYVGRGNVKRARGDLDGAIEDYGAAIALNPKAAEAYINRANVRRQKGDSEGAMADLNSAARNGAPDPSSVVPRSGSAVVGPNERGGKRGGDDVVVSSRTEVVAVPDAAVVQRGATTEIDSPDGAKMGAALALSNRGGELMRRGDADGAIEDYSKSIEIYPTAVAYGNRSAARLGKGDRDGALADVNRALELAPRAAVYYYQRATIYAGQGKAGEAKKDLEQCLKLDPNMRPMVESALRNLNPPGDKEP